MYLCIYLSIIFIGVLSVNINKIIKNAYKDYDDRTKGYTHSLFIVLKDKKSLEYYDKNILHNMIKSTVIKPLLDIDVESPVLCTDWEDNRINIRNPSGRFDYYLYNKYSYSIVFSILITLGFYTLRVRSRL